MSEKMQILCLGESMLDSLVEPQMPTSASSLINVVPPVEYLEKAPASSGAFYSSRLTFAVSRINTC
ncbi:MAG: hypothetical protein ACXVMI_15525, partial [Flavisolibacter sp.]